MSRSGYVEDLERLNLYRGRVARTMNGKRGQAFLRDLAAAMDAMPEKMLIANDLINGNGDCCAIGVVCLDRGIDVRTIDPERPEQVGSAVDISRTMAAEISYMNDEDCCHIETPQQRWTRIRKWIGTYLQPPDTEEK